MNEVPKLGIEVEGSCLAVAEELGLNNTLGGAGSAVLGRDHLSKVIGDGVEDP